MAIDYQIPLSAGPAGAAKVDTQIPMGGDTRLPLMTKPFEPIDVGQAQAKTASEEDTLGQFQEAQAKRLESQQMREEKARDKGILTEHQQNGGDLHSADGLDMALKKLGPRLSVATAMNLADRAKEQRESEVKFRDMLNKSSDAVIEHLHTVSEAATQVMNKAYRVYETTPGTEQAKLAAFNAAKPQIIADAVKNAPMLEGKLQDLNNKTPEQLKLEIGDATWMHKDVQDEALVRYHNSQAKAADALAGKRDVETELAPQKLRLLQDKHEAALEAAKTKKEFDEKSADDAATLIASNRLAPLSGYALRTPYGQRVMSLVATKNPDYDAKDYYTYSKGEKSFTSGKQGDIARSFNVAINHVDSLMTMADALGTSDFKTFNKLSNWAKTEFGVVIPDATTPAAFDSVKTLVANEIGKAIRGSGGSAEERLDAEHKISAANAPAVLKSVLDAYMPFMKGQLEGLRQQYKASTDKDDFDKRFLTPTAQRVSEGGDKPNLTGPTTDSADGSNDTRVQVLQTELDDAKSKLSALPANATQEDRHRVEQDVASLEREVARVKGSKKKSGAISLDAYLKSNGY